MHARTLFAEFRLALLARRNDHVTDRGGRQLVQTTTHALDADNKQGLGTRVVGTVHHSAVGQTQRRVEFVTGRANASFLRSHCGRVLMIGTGPRIFFCKNGSYPGTRGTGNPGPPKILEMPRHSVA